MPTLLDKRSWKITMYFGDHNPPHFHIVTRGGGEAQVEIATLALLAGEVDARILAAAREWAVERKEFLFAKWEEFRRPPG